MRPSTIGPFFFWRYLPGPFIFISIVLLVGYYSSSYYFGMVTNPYMSGLVLMGLLIFLVAYWIRKQFPFLAWGRSSVWLKCHLYTGWLAVMVFGIHTGLRYPTGLLETWLYATFVAVVASGLWGWWLIRTVPRKLSQLPEEFLLDDIPAYRHHVCREAQGLAQASARLGGTSTLASWYRREVATYFLGPRSWWYQWSPTSRRRRQLVGRIQELTRYAAPAEQSLFQQMAQLVERKDNLDYHQAQQQRMKTWLFVHSGGTVMLICLSLFHAVLAHAHHGGLH